MKVLLGILSTFLVLTGFAQSTVEFTFELDSTDEHLEIDQLRYYVTSVQLLNGEQIVYEEEDSYHLIDHSDKNSTTLSLRLPSKISYDAIQFNIGVDSAKNMQGVHGGDLDPTKGMYWTWQSGYINFKMEGNLDDQELSYHIGGFMYPNNACRNVKLQLESDDQSYIISIHPSKLVDQLDYEKVNHIMSPGKSANLIADMLPSLFSIK